MVTISDDFVSETAKVRMNGSSFIVGFNKDTCRHLGIGKGTRIQIYYKKIGDTSEPTPTPSL